MMWLPDGGKISKISFFVLTECTNVTDGQTDGRTDRHRMTAKAALDASSGLRHRAAKMESTSVGFTATSTDADAVTPSE